MYLIQAPVLENVLFSCSQVLAKGKKRAGFLRHICREVNTDISCKIYLSFVRPVLEYACPVWHSDINAEQSLALERVQATVARSILKADWRTPKSALLQRLGWPALRWRRTIISMVLFHRLLRTAGPLGECVRVFPFSSSVSGRAKRKPLQLLLQPIRFSKRLKSFLTLPFFGTLSLHLFSLSNDPPPLSQHFRNSGLNRSMTFLMTS